MANYSTGELAKKVGVSIRTVQYYDRRQLLSPAKLSEAGRRVYTDHELEQLELITFLKSLGLSLNNIKELLNSPNFDEVLQTLLNQEELQLKQKIKQQEDTLKTIGEIKHWLTDQIPITPNSFIGIEESIRRRRSLTRKRSALFVFGGLIDILEILAMWYGISSSNWWAVVAAFCPIIVAVAIAVYAYYRSVEDVCPQCEAYCKPAFGEFFWAKHSPKTRWLGCPNCDYEGYCVEI